MTTKQFEQVREALQALDRVAFEPDSVKVLWKALTKAEKDAEEGTPTEWDLRYEVPDVPPSMSVHTSQGEPQELAPHVMWKGYHYTLSPGQRRWFRENTGMTPARTVTVDWVQVWPGTRYPRSFKVVSDQHIDPRLRKHTIAEMVIRSAGEFFAAAYAFDQEEATEGTLSIKVGPVNVWTAKHRWAVNDLSGAKLQGQEVEIVECSNVSILFQDSAGRRGLVDRDEFLSTVADYVRLDPENGAKPRKTAGGATVRKTPSLDDLMAELTKGCEVEV